MKRFAAHTVITPQATYTQAVVEVEQGIVRKIYTFTHEQAQTVWKGGTITVRENAQGQLEAYHEGRKLI